MTQQLSQHEMMELKNAGYNEGEIQQALKEIEMEDLMLSYNQLGQKQDPRKNASYSAFGVKAPEDLARWQLELNDILEKAEHILKGDIIVFEGGMAIWKNNPTPQNNTLNEFGVQLIMQSLAMYVNRHKILADYTEDEIRFKVYDFGIRLNNLIFKKYEEMGMDTEEKRKEYEMIVGEVVDLIHDSYARAKDGRERESYRKMISVSQMSPNPMMSPNGVTVNAGMGGGQRARGLLNPLRYVVGKYY